MSTDAENVREVKPALVTTADGFDTRVATYRWRSGYMGPQVRTLCRSCGAEVEAARKESTFGHAELWATNDGDWHEGICENHRENQRTIDRVGRNMGAE